MVHHPAVSDFVARLDVCTDTVSLESTMADFLSFTGFSRFAYNIFRSQAADVSSEGSCLVISNYPNRWKSHYLSENYNKIDPVLHGMNNLSDMVYWNTVRDDVALTKRQRQLFEEAQDIGLHDGLTFPIATELGESAAFSIVPDTPFEKERGDVLANIPLIRLVAQTYHHKAKRILIDASLKPTSCKRKSLLSSRELDVLRWAAKGKTGWEIAKILMISSKSVEAYLETAKNKLRATNRTHAVVKAIMFGMINVND